MPCLKAPEPVQLPQNIWADRSCGASSAWVIHRAKVDTCEDFAAPTCRSGPVLQARLGAFSAHSAAVRPAGWWYAFNSLQNDSLSQQKPGLCISCPRTILARLSACDISLGKAEDTLNMGQNPVPPVNIPIPTKIGSKMGAEFTENPKMGSKTALTTTAVSKTVKACHLPLD